MMKAERQIITELQEKLERMDARIRELETGEHTGPASTLSDVEKVLYIREAVRRDMRGDGSMRKAWNRRNAPKVETPRRGVSTTTRGRM